MIGRGAAAFAGVAIVALVCVIVLTTGGDRRYAVTVPLKDASGLRDGGQVVRGGRPVGVVRLKLTKDDDVVARIVLDDGQRPVSRDSTIAISAVNLLGRKRLEIVGGTPSRPAASGSTLSAGRVIVGTDLDQLLDVLDVKTRSRLSILLNEAGRTVVGRKTDIGALLANLPRTLQDGAALFAGLSTDTGRLDDLVVHSDRLVSALAPDRRTITRLIDGFGDLAAVVAERRQQVGASLRTAPTTLARVRQLLTQLRSTSDNLGPAARNIATTATQLDGALDELHAARVVAVPALRTAATVAPELSALATTATPVLRSATPVATGLAALSQSLKPVSAALDLSAPDMFAILDNWSKAVELRDGLSHVFRGEASVAPEVLRDILKLNLPSTARRTKNKAQPAASGSPAASTPPAAPESAGTQRPDAPAAPKPLSPLLDAVGKTLDGVLGRVPRRPSGSSASATSAQAPASPQESVQALLDYLLG